MATTVDELDEMEVRIPFGPRPNQTMPASWAAAMLSLWRERHPAQFGKTLAEVVTGAAES